MKTDLKSSIFERIRLFQGVFSLFMAKHFIFAKCSGLYYDKKHKVLHKAPFEMRVAHALDRRL